MKTVPKLYKKRPFSNIEKYVFRDPQPKSNNNKSLGLLFFFVFIIVSFWPLLNGGNVRIWSIVIAIIFLTLALVKPQILNPLTKLWIKFGELIGKFISPIVIGLIYFVILTPIGLLMRLFNKDLKSESYHFQAINYKYNFSYFYSCTHK